MSSTQTVSTCGDGTALSADHTYSAVFSELEGGRVEYVVTVSCVIGKSRMKGETVVSNLMPYGPERPRNGLVRSADSDQIEIFWDPPKGQFHR